MGKEEDACNHEGDKQEQEEEDARWGSYGRQKARCRFPQPITLLARTANLAGHMPWVLKRIYKDDGSLVIQKIRVMHHEYFRASREGGRLVLKHVYLDDTYLLEHNPNRYQEENDTITLQSPPEEEEENEAVVLESSPTVSPLVSSGFMDRECTFRGDRMDFNTPTSKMFARSSLMELSSSIPEPIFPEVRKGCFEKGKASLLCSLPRMRAVSS